MTHERDFDRLARAWLELAPDEAPDRVVAAVLQAAEATPQVRRRVAWPTWRSFSMNRLPMAAGAAAILVILVGAGFLLSRQPETTGAGVAATPSPTAVPSAASVSPTPAVSPGPSRFMSPLYHYAVDLPAGWLAREARLPWRTGMPGYESPVIDVFHRPDGELLWGFAGSTDLDLAGLTDERIAANLADHGDTCPPKPALREPIDVAGQPGMMLAWDCGLLINMAFTIKDGISYQFVFRDSTIVAATDAADRATFDHFLNAIELP